MSTASPTIARFEYRRSVQFVDTDASGFAHFSTYVRMMEETEYAFLRSRGLSVVLHDGRGTMGFPRLSANIEIHHPLAFEDSVDVILRLTEIDGKQIFYEFEIIDRASERLAVEGRFRVACCRFPADKDPYAILTPETFIEALTLGGTVENS